MRDRLTYKWIERLREPGRYADGGNLWLQVRSVHSKSWLFRFTLNGRARQMGLGAFPDLGLAEAREKARFERLRLSEGLDPIEERNPRRAEQRRAQASTLTFRDAAMGVIADREDGWSAEHARQWGASIAACERILGNVPCSQIDTELVMKVVEPVWRKTEVTGDRLRQRIEVTLDWAAARGARSGDNPARWKGHLEHLLKDSHKVRHLDAMPYNAVPAFVSELRARPGTAARALEFLVLCASRSGEVLGARWEEIDLDQKTWTIPAARMKADKDHVVPLAPAALKILAALPRNSEFVFAAPRTGRQMERHALMDVMRTMGRAETVHGFRSAFADWAADNTDFPQEVREQALAHAIPNKVEAAYRRGALLEKRRRLMAAWGEYLTKS